jgi:SAM-dependent methyltransferase
MTFMTWREGERRRSAQRALVRQLLYQRQKADSVKGRESTVVAHMLSEAARVRGLLEHGGTVSRNARLLEVGSGSHGLIFYFASAGLRVGIDPLAVEYVRLFPHWQRRAPTCAASGDALPFVADAFDIVLCDNVIDHAEKPDAIVKELGRVLKPNGLLYFSVNVHHPVYRYASLAHAAWNAIGLPLEIGPFADHTVHLRLRDVRGMLSRLPVRLVMEREDEGSARQLVWNRAPRHAGDWVKRLFVKNVRYEAVAVKHG